MNDFTCPAGYDPDTCPERCTNECEKPGAKDTPIEAIARELIVSFG